MTDTGDRLKDPDWRHVVRIYAAYGLRAYPNLSLLPEGVAYARGRAALGFDPPGAHPLALHDLAHWMVAPEWRRGAVNFGLGPHPTVEETGRAPELVRDALITAEEALVSDLNVALVDFYFDRRKAARVADYLSCQDGVGIGPETLFTPGRFNQSAATAARFRARLEARGLLRGGRFEFKEVPRGD